MGDKNFYSTDEVAEMFNVSPKAVRDWIKSGKLSAYKIGKNYKISQENLDIFLKKSQISE